MLNKKYTLLNFMIVTAGLLCFSFNLIALHNAPPLSSRMMDTIKKHPYVTALAAAGIVGFGYASYATYTHPGNLDTLCTQYAQRTRKELVDEGFPEDAIKLTSQGKKLIVRKLVFDPTRPFKTLVIGDSHGEYQNIRELLATCRCPAWLKKNPRHHLIFLGDYIDSNPQGQTERLVEHILTLHKKHPQQVHLMKGDWEHEWNQTFTVGGSQTNKVAFLHALTSALYLTPTRPNRKRQYPTLLFSHGGLPTPEPDNDKPRTFINSHYAYEELLRSQRSIDLIETGPHKSLLTGTWGDKFGKEPKYADFARLTPEADQKGAEAVSEHVQHRSNNQYPIASIVRAHEHHRDHLYKTNAIGMRAEDIPKVFTVIASSANKRTPAPSAMLLRWDPATEAWFISLITTDEAAYGGWLKNEVALSEFPLKIS